MLYRSLGKSGLKVSLLSFGTWITFSQLEISSICTLIQYAFDHGINLFDTAEVYGQGVVESKLGETLKKLMLPREKFILSSKVFWGGNSKTECGLTRKHIIEGCHQSLTRLQTSYLDLYLCHRPDPTVPVLETVIAMNILIQQGKILYWGTSEWPNELIEAYYVAKENHLIAPSLEQLEYNLLSRNRMEALLPTAQDKTGIGVCTTMPLACGLLTGRYNKGIPVDSRANIKTQDWLKQLIRSEQGENNIRLTKKFEDYARDVNIDMASLALCWCMSNPRVSSVIFGANKLEQMKKNIQTVELFGSQNLPSDFLNQMNNIFGPAYVGYQEPSYEEVVAES